MATKRLNLVTTLDDKQAKRALQGLVQQFREADAISKKLMMSNEKTAKSLKSVHSSALQARDSMGRFAKESSMAAAVTSRAFSGVLMPALQRTGMQLQRMIKWGTLFATVTGGFYMRKAFQDLITWSDEFSLMNATLKAQLPETLTFLQRKIFDISNAVGRPAEEISKGITQFLSADLAPTAREGTAEYIQQLEDLIKIQDIVAKGAVGTGTSIEEMSDAVIIATTAFDKNLRSTKDVSDIVGMFMGNLDTGVGLMKEYTGQYGKFAKVATQAGFTPEEATSIFARFTKTQPVERAGMAAQSFFREMTQPISGATQAKNKVKQALKEVTLSPQEIKALTPFSNADAWMDIMFTDTYDANGNRIKKSGKAALDAMAEALKNAPNKSLLLDIMMDAMFPNYRAALGGREVISELGMEDIFGDGGILDKTRKAVENQSYLEKFQIKSKSFAAAWGRITNTIRNETLEATMAMAPALGLVFDLISSKLSGAQRQFKDADIAEVFANVRQELAKSSPALVGFVGIIEKLFNYINDGTAERHLQQIGSAIKTIGSVIMAAMGAFEKFWGFLDRITGGNVVANIGITWVGANMARAALGGIIQGAFSQAFGGVGASVVGASLTRTIGASLVGAVGMPFVIAAVVGLFAGAILAGILKARQEAAANRGADMQTNASDTHSLLMSASGGDEMAFQALASKLSTLKGKKYDLGWLPEDTARRISKEQGIGMWEAGRLGNTSADALIQTYGMDKAKGIANIISEANQTSGMGIEIAGAGKELANTIFALQQLEAWKQSHITAYEQNMSPAGPGAGLFYSDAFGKYMMEGIVPAMQTQNDEVIAGLSSLEETLSSKDTAPNVSVYLTPGEYTGQPNVTTVVGPGNRSAAGSNFTPAFGNMSLAR